jgi:hypothetical protein
MGHAVNKARDDEDGGTAVKRFWQLIHKRLEIVCG